MSDKLISLESVLKEIRRFKGYIDDDMIERFSIAFKRLPAVPQEMSAREYLRTMRPICEDGRNCGKCPLSYNNNGVGINCQDYAAYHPEEAVAAVEAWVREHPKRSEEDG